MPTVRRLDPEDWRIWRELRLAALADDPAYAEALVTETERREADWRRVIDEPHGVKLVGGPTPDYLTGILVAHVNDSGAAEVYSMWVRPTSRRGGVAIALLDEARRWAVERGLTRLTLKVFVDNEGAQALYRRFGLTPTGYRGVHQLTGLPDLEMAMTLPAAVQDAAVQDAAVQDDMVQDDTVQDGAAGSAQDADGAAGS